MAARRRKGSSRRSRSAKRRRHGSVARPSTGQIVVAWKVDSSEIVDPHRTRVDLGESYKTRPKVESQAAMWVRSGTAVDVEKAEVYARREAASAAKDPRSATGYGHRVFVYPATEKDPLGRARKEVLRG